MTNRCVVCDVEAEEQLMWIRNNDGGLVTVCQDHFSNYHKNLLSEQTKRYQAGLIKEKGRIKIQNGTVVIVNLAVLVWNLSGIFSGRFTYWFFDITILIVSAFQMFALYKLLKSSIDLLKTIEDDPYAKLLEEFEAEWTEMDKRLARLKQQEN